MGLPLLFTRFPLLKIYLSRTLIILPYFLYFRFIRSFLEIPARYPALNKWIVPLEYFLLGYMVFDFVFILITFDQQRQNTFFTFVLLSVFVLSTSFIIYLFRYRQTLIYYVLTGSLVVALGYKRHMSEKEKIRNNQARDTIGEIKDSSFMLMERMDDIVWSINPRNDSLDHLLMRVRHFATTLFEARGIEYTIEIQKNLHEVKATQAILCVRFDQPRLTLFVKDNGRGLDMGASSSGNGIPGMQRRADLMGARLNINSAPGEGTEVVLTAVIDG